MHNMPLDWCKWLNLLEVGGPDWCTLSITPKNMPLREKDTRHAKQECAAVKDAECMRTSKYLIAGS
jgi:hypothetical protein